MTNTNHPGGGSRPAPAPSGRLSPGPGTPSGVTRRRPFKVHQHRCGTWHIFGPEGRLTDFFQLEAIAAARCSILNDTYEAGYDAGHRDAEPCDGCGAADGVGCPPWCEFHPDKTHPRQGEA